MKSLACLLIFLTVSAFGRNERPYKILIIADEHSSQSAEAYRSYIMQQRPYNRMRPEDLVVEIQTVTAAEMECTNPGTTNNRLIRCDNDYLRGLRRDARASIAVAFTSTATGGAGGEIPLATSNFADYPISTMFHEMLHAYGFADEYQYQTEAERDSFCDPPRRLPNIAYFNDEPPYASDASARSRHGSEVPWMGTIPADVLITHGTDLGTTELPATVRGDQATGLFAGGPCSLWRKSWRPYQGSIMREYTDDTVYPLYENVILDRIEDAIGRRPVLDATPAPPPTPPTPPTPAPEVVITAPEPDCPPKGSEPLVQVQDFSRNTLRVIEGMDDEEIRVQLKKIQEYYGSPAISGILPPEFILPAVDEIPAAKIPSLVVPIEGPQP